MNLKFILLVSQGVFLLLSLLLVTSALRVGNLYDLLTVFFVLLFFIVVLLMANRKHWAGLFLAGWMISMSIPIPPLDTVTVGFILLCMIGGLYVLEQIVQRRLFFSLKGWGNVLLFIVASILIMRFAMDRPGSARMGGVGGLRHALGYTAALPFFFISEMLGRELSDTNTRKILRFLCGVAITMIVWRFVMRFAGFAAPMPFYLGWYEGAMWLLAPLVLAWLLNRRAQVGKFPIAALIFSGVMLLLGVLSPFRSRIFFALGSIAAVFWCSGYRRRFVVGSIVLLCVVVPLFAFMPQERIPVIARRALSTVLPYDMADVDAIRDRGVDVSGEYGWGSGFRAFLFDAAVRNIRRNPWMGQGWGISLDDLVMASSFDPYERMMYGLVASGEYHNSMLTVAVKSGLPAAILLSLGLLVVLVPCVKKAKQLPENDVHTKILYIGIMGGLVAITGQMLMNGGYRELQGICVYLGFLHGTLRSHAMQSDENDGESLA